MDAYVKMRRKTFDVSNSKMEAFAEIDKVFVNKGHSSTIGPKASSLTVYLMYVITALASGWFGGLVGTTLTTRKLFSRTLH